MSEHHEPCGPSDASRSAVFEVLGPLVPADVPVLCEQARAMLGRLDPGTPVECDVTRLGTPDAVALDALARLQLTAGRLGFEVRLRGASPQLRALLRGTGLCQAIPLAPPSGGVDPPDG